MAVPAPGSLRDRFRGALLGTLLGDALGMPVEGWDAGAIRRELGEVREMLDARRGRGTFTDDTQMCAALAEALLETGSAYRPDPVAIARAFACRFDPDRGYGRNTGGILREIRAGAPWEEVLGRRRLPGGSFANGAAMRVAPAALAGFPRVARVTVIADLQARATGHDHPDGRFGARLQAAAVLACLGEGASASPPEPATLLESAGAGWRGPVPAAFVRRLEWIGLNREADAEDAASVIGTGVAAAEAVPAALFAFLSHPDDPEEAMVTAVGMGGDTDTIAAMAGALAGARHGASALPARWLAAAEDGACGKSGLTSLADALFERQSGPGPEEAAEGA